LIDQAVTNSTCLIALHRIGQLDLLPRLCSTIMVPQVVLEEVGELIPFLTVQSPVNRAAVAALMTQLDQGEAEAIALATELGSLPVILDDKKARRVAQQIGLRVIGTIGILLRAKRESLLAELETPLKALQSAGFHMTEALYREALRLAGE